jgi:F-type H+-transporting ATPase subunit b
MLYLADFSVMNPSFGLLFWTTIIFILVWLVLGRFFKAIRNALTQREGDIQTALDQAAVARQDVGKLQAEIEAMKRKASEERTQIVREAEAMKANIIEEAKAKAEENTNRMLESAKQEIDNRRKEMEISLYNQAGNLAVIIAEQIMHKELEGKHDEFIASKVEELKNSDLQANYN